MTLNNVFCEPSLTVNLLNSVTAHEIPAEDAFRFESDILENYLAVSTWILNESSIECQEKKHQRFSLCGVRFGSRAIQISG